MVAPTTEVRPEQAVSRMYLTKSIVNARNLLQFAFTLAPIIAGLDKFFHVLVNWNIYLNPAVAASFPGGANTFMGIVGVVEIAAGLIVAFRPAIGGTIVGIWELCIVANLLSIPGYYDIALRDFGLALGAFSLAMLSRGIGACEVRR
jgi:hypothetical protein